MRKSSSTARDATPRGMVGLVGARQFFLALVGAGRRLFACVFGLLALVNGARFLFTFTNLKLSNELNASHRTEEVNSN